MKRHSRSASEGSIPGVDIEANKGQTTDCSDVKIKKHTFLKQLLIDYAANSNLHGLKYIGEKDTTLIEKIFWLFMFSCCVIFCMGKIHLIWIRWNESPVIVSFAEKSTPVWQIPYPAVTICSETKSRQTLFNMTEYYHLYHDKTTRSNMTEKERRLYEDLSMVCDVHFNPFIKKKTTNGKETIENLKKLSPNISDMFFSCKWRNVVTFTCSDLFFPIITEDGICYTFNTLGAEELLRIENLNKDYKYLEYSKRNSSQIWTLEGGYPHDSQLETYPHRGTGYGVNSGLSVLLKAKRLDMDYLCRGPVQGFKILLHNPAEFPRLSEQYFRSPLSQEVVVAVKPNMMTTSEGLKLYEAPRRQCYLSTERYLKYFKIYTQANCEMECLSNFTYARCGCVHFGMPHGPEIPVCNAYSMVCVRQSQRELTTAEIQNNLGKDTAATDTLGDALHVATECKCLQSCTSIEYDAETSQADFDWKAVFRAYRLDIDEENKDMSVAKVLIFFKEGQFITSRRSELYGQTEFLANVGGLLGLFLGFSILSLAEILYFLTLRLGSSLWKRRQEEE